MCIRDRHTEHPVIQVRIFRKNPAYACANAAALLNYGATFAISYLLSIYCLLYTSRCV